MIITVEKNLLRTASVFLVDKSCWVWRRSFREFSWWLARCSEPVRDAIREDAMWEFHVERALCAAPCSGREKPKTWVCPPWELPYVRTEIFTVVDRYRENLSERVKAVSWPCGLVASKPHRRSRVNLTTAHAASWRARRMDEDDNLERERGHPSSSSMNVLLWRQSNQPLSHLHV